MQSSVVEVPRALVASLSFLVTRHCMTQQGSSEDVASASVIDGEAVPETTTANLTAVDAAPDSHPSLDVSEDTMSTDVLVLDSPTAAIALQSASDLCILLLHRVLKQIPGGWVVGNAMTDLKIVWNVDRLSVGCSSSNPGDHPAMPSVITTGAQLAVTIQSVLHPWLDDLIEEDGFITCDREERVALNLWVAAGPLKIARVHPLGESSHDKNNDLGKKNGSACRSNTRNGGDVLGDGDVMFVLLGDCAERLNASQRIRRRYPSFTAQVSEPLPSTYGAPDDHHRHGGGVGEEHHPSYPSEDSSHRVSFPEWLHVLSPSNTNDASDFGSPPQSPTTTTTSGGMMCRAASRSFSVEDFGVEMQDAMSHTAIVLPSQQGGSATASILVGELDVCIEAMSGRGTDDRTEDRRIQPTEPTEDEEGRREEEAMLVILGRAMRNVHRVLLHFRGTMLSYSQVPSPPPPPTPSTTTTTTTTRANATRRISIRLVCSLPRIDMSRRTEHFGLHCAEATAWLSDALVSAVDPQRWMATPSPVANNQAASTDDNETAPLLLSGDLRIRYHVGTCLVQGHVSKSILTCRMSRHLTPHRTQRQETRIIVGGDPIQRACDMLRIAKHRAPSHSRGGDADDDVDDSHHRFVRGTFFSICEETVAHALEHHNSDAFEWSSPTHMDGKIPPHLAFSFVSQWRVDARHGRQGLHRLSEELCRLKLSSTDSIRTLVGVRPVWESLGLFLQSAMSKGSRDDDVGGHRQQHHSDPTTLSVEMNDTLAAPDDKKKFTDSLLWACAVIGAPQSGKTSFLLDVACRLSAALPVIALLDGQSSRPPSSLSFTPMKKCNPVAPSPTRRGGHVTDGSSVAHIAPLLLSILAQLTFAVHRRLSKTAAPTSNSHPPPPKEATGDSVMDDGMTLSEVAAAFSRIFALCLEHGLSTLCVLIDDIHRLDDDLHSIRLLGEMLEKETRLFRREKAKRLRMILLVTSLDENPSAFDSWRGSSGSSASSYVEVTLPDRLSPLFSPAGSTESSERSITALILQQVSPRALTDVLTVHGTSVEHSSCTMNWLVRALYEVSQGSILTLCTLVAAMRDPCVLLCIAQALTRIPHEAKCYEGGVEVPLVAQVGWRALCAKFNDIASGAEVHGGGGTFVKARYEFIGEWLSLLSPGETAWVARVVCYCCAVGSSDVPVDVCLQLAKPSLGIDDDDDNNDGILDEATASATEPLCFLDDLLSSDRKASAALSTPTTSTSPQSERRRRRRPLHYLIHPKNDMTLSLAAACPPVVLLRLLQPRVIEAACQTLTLSALYDAVSVSARLWLCCCLGKNEDRSLVPDLETLFASQTSQPRCQEIDRVCETLRFWGYPSESVALAPPSLHHPHNVSASVGSSPSSSSGCPTGVLSRSPDIAQFAQQQSMYNEMLVGLEGIDGRKKRHRRRIMFGAVVTVPTRVVEVDVALEWLLQCWKRYELAWRRRQLLTQQQREQALVSRGTTTTEMSGMMTSPPTSASSGMFPSFSTPMSTNDSTTLYAHHNDNFGNQHSSSGSAASWCESVCRLLLCRRGGGGNNETEPLIGCVPSLVCEAEDLERCWNTLEAIALAIQRHPTVDDDDDVGGVTVNAAGGGNRDLRMALTAMGDLVSRAVSSAKLSFHHRPAQRGGGDSDVVVTDGGGGSTSSTSRPRQQHHQRNAASSESNDAEDAMPYDWGVAYQSLLRTLASSTSEILGAAQSLTTQRLRKIKTEITARIPVSILRDGFYGLHDILDRLHQHRQRLQQDDSLTNATRSVMLQQGVASSIHEALSLACILSVEVEGLMALVRRCMHQQSKEGSVSTTTCSSFPPSPLSNAMVPAVFTSEDTEYSLMAAAEEEQVTSPMPVIRDTVGDQHQAVASTDISFARECMRRYVEVLLQLDTHVRSNRAALASDFFEVVLMMLTTCVSAVARPLSAAVKVVVGDVRVDNMAEASIEIPYNLSKVNRRHGADDNVSCTRQGETRNSGAASASSVWYARVPWVEPLSIPKAVSPLTTATVESSKPVLVTSVGGWKPKSKRSSATAVASANAPPTSTEQQQQQQHQQAVASQ